MVSKAENVLEIEIDGPHNRSLVFRPIGERVRGRFDVKRAAEFDAGAAGLFNEWPSGIPGQRIGIDLESGEGYVREPLHDGEHKALADKIAKRGETLPDARKSFGAVHVPTWLYWLRDAVRAGLARVVRGTLPEAIDGKPQIYFNSEPPKPDPTERLAAAMERQNELLLELLRKK